MFKKFLLALVVALPFCAFAQAPKFGVVDVEGIIPKMAEFVEAQNKIGEASKTFESEYAKDCKYSCNVDDGTVSNNFMGGKVNIDRDYTNTFGGYAFIFSCW